jgi:hypothetical protein
MTPFVLGLSATASMEILSVTHLWGMPDWLAGFFIIAGMIFLFGVLPIVVLWLLGFELRRR